MLFNSLTFLLFFIIILFGYYNLARYRNIFLLVANFFFYMYWNPLFGILLLYMILLGYSGARLVYKSASPSRRNMVMTLWILLLLMPLCYYKYLGFFTSALSYYMPFNRLDALGTAAAAIVIPVGISFFTFQTVGYLVDVHRQEIEPLSLFDTALFISCFPQLNAGPIGRAAQLVPQFHQPPEFRYDRVVSGVALFLQGMFKKLVVADRLAEYVNAVYGNSSLHSGPSLLLATVFFTIQLYADFAGYSDMAVGVARMLNIDVIMNFQRPLLATNMRFFWSRWHVSLTTWFRDYLFMPLYRIWNEKRKKASFHKILLLSIIVFGVSGLWHGAGWTFIVWGMLNGFYLGMEPTIQKKWLFLEQWKNRSRILDLIIVTAQRLVVFVLFGFSMVFFRAKTLQEAWQIVTKIFIPHSGGLFKGEADVFLYCLLSISVLWCMDLYDEHKKTDAGYLVHKSLWGTAAAIAIMLSVILFFGVLDESQFIYFQF